ncbi:MAG: hypothetical protein L6R19_12240, partial [Alphaproteobacteria bacterium]|nr:hypothetical protein [Alphaproteobacteria bacterium]
MELINLSIGWLEKHDKFAAWAQAFAAVVALFLAIAVPVFQRWLEDRAERRRRRLEGEFIAVAIYSDILEMRARWQRVRGFAGRWPARADIAELLTHDAGVRRGLAEELRQARLDMPPTFEAEMPRFMLLGD